MTTLESIIAKANRGGHSDWDTSGVTCADGFTMSVITGGGAYCSPRPAFCYGGRCDNPIPGEVECSFTGPFTAVEVGFPSVRPEPWDQWTEFCEEHDDPTQTVYGYVPVEQVRALVAAHGGEVA